MADRKLVVLGIPWDVDTEGLKGYMSKFGDLEDCIVMKERATGRSRGFGYVTFATDDDAKAALSSEHNLGNRMLEVKIATPKEEMRAPSKKVSRIFVARIPASVTQSEFRSYFEKYGEITDLYMPKDPATKGHRGIGFITFVNSDSVDDLMAETHELGGSTVVVDRATPKEEDYKTINRAPQGGYGAYSAYINATTRYGAIGAPTLYDRQGSMYGSSQQFSRGMGKKIFVGKLPQEATAEDLRLYFGKFGQIMDVYVPKDPKRTGHRGFGFVTFAEDGVADRVSRRPHEICGQQVAIDSATPVDDAGPSSSFVMNNPEHYGGYSGPMRSYGRMYGSMEYDDLGYGMAAARPSRADYDMAVGRPSRVEYDMPVGRPSRADYGMPVGRPSRADYGMAAGRTSRADYGMDGRPSRADYGMDGRPSRTDYGMDAGRPSRADMRYRPY